MVDFSEREKLLAQLATLARQGGLSQEEAAHMSRDFLAKYEAKIKDHAGPIQFEGAHGFFDR